MILALVDYGSGNLHSVYKALERAACEGGHTATLHVTADPRQIEKADRVVLPGVGAFADCRRGLEALPGMIEALNETVIEKARPFLGICVGMQLMATQGQEFQTVPGLDWIEGKVEMIRPVDSQMKVPHMGWNTLDETRSHPLLADIPVGPNGLHAYFVHSFHLHPKRQEDILARTDYGGAITAMVARANLAGTQFHPEKSQKLGLLVLRNFLGWRP